MKVVICDTIPKGMSFVSLDGKPSIGTTSVTGNIITWTIDKLQIKQKGTITYTAKADGSCPNAPDLDIIDRSWISADKESPVADSSLVSISCDSVPKPPAPDHIDIVLDTASVDPKHDIPIESITIDENSGNVKLYAVVRDKNGNFISWANVTWTSSDPAIGSVASQDTFTGVVKKVSSGTITVTASHSGLKSDSITVLVAQPPPYPVISSAIMLDTNADLIPDMLTLTLTDTFKLGQHLDSISISYKGNTYLVPASNAVLSGTVLNVPFSSLSGIDPQPSGTSTIVLTSDNSTKRNSKVFTDGVGPALQSAILNSNSAGSSDTMILTFSELIKTASLTGSTLLLIRQGSNDTVPLQISGLIGQDAYAQKVTVLVNGTIRPSEGDWLRLVGGSSSTAVHDISDNPPHLLNRPVAIISKPPQIVSAWYSDVNADGTVESVFFKFQKNVIISDLDVSLDWNGAKVNHLSLPNFSYNATDSTIIKVSLPDSCMNKNVMRTSGIMQGLVKFNSFPDESRTPVIADSAAPVITKAVISPDISENALIHDTLRVTFSEKSRVADMINPFFLNRVSLTPTIVTLSSLKTDDTSATFLVTNYGNIDYPRTGDSIWIVPQNKVSDIVPVWQNNDKNRRALLSVDFSRLKWKVSLGPNPFMPGSGQSLKISLNPSGVKRPVLVDATITIYDAVGNVVMPTRVLSGNFQWNGRNRDGRYLGAGTYVGIIEIKGETKEIQKVMIGVRR